MGAVPSRWLLCACLCPRKRPRGHPGRPWGLGVCPGPLSGLRGQVLVVGQAPLGLGLPPALGGLGGRLEKQV